MDNTEINESDKMLRQMEEMMDLESGELETEFVVLNSLSCCKVISNMMKEITTGVAVSPAVLRPCKHGDQLREYITHLISILRDLRQLFLEEHVHNDKHRNRLH
tara:strand:+ start:171 stop:482 length:312 start_codon:yes stop_codon:yes gene_type:complete